MAQRTLAIVKPDGVARALVGEVIRRFERAGLRLAALSVRRPTRTQAERHYGEHAGRPYFEDLVRFTTSGPVVVMALEGEDAVQRARALAGPTRVAEAARGTIRGDFGILGRPVPENIVHTSDSADAAEREIAMWFGPEVPPR